MTLPFGLALRLGEVPGHHLLQRDVHHQTGIATQMLVGEKQHLFAPGKAPLQYSAGVGTGADNATVLAAETFQVRR